MKKIFQTTILFTSVFLLAACGATSSSRSFKEAYRDNVTKSQVRMKLAHSDKVKARNIKVDVYRGVVKLSGQVDSETESSQVERLVSSVDSVVTVENNLASNGGNRNRYSAPAVAPMPQSTPNSIAVREPVMPDYIDKSAYPASGNVSAARKPIITARPALPPAPELPIKSAAQPAPKPPVAAPIKTQAPATPVAAPVAAKPVTPTVVEKKTASMPPPYITMEPDSGNDKAESLGLEAPDNVEAETASEATRSGPKTVHTPGWMIGSKNDAQFEVQDLGGTNPVAAGDGLAKEAAQELHRLKVESEAAEEE